MPNPIGRTNIMPPPPPAAEEVSNPDPAASGSDEGQAADGRPRTGYESERQLDKIFSLLRGLK